MFGQPLKNVVVGMRMVVPPVLARETHNRLAGKGVVGRRCSCWREILFNRNGCGNGSSEVHAWQTPAATASLILASFADSDCILVISLKSTPELWVVIPPG